MNPKNVIIKSRDGKTIFIKELTHKGVPGLWICNKEAWEMKNKDISQKEFRALVMQFMVEMREFKENQLEFNKNQLEFNRNITNKLDRVIDLNNLKTQ